MLEGGGSTVSLLAALLSKFVPCPCLLCIYVKFPNVKLSERKGEHDKECVATHFSKGRNEDLQEVGGRRGSENARGHSEAFLP